MGRVAQEDHPAFYPAVERRPVRNIRPQDLRLRGRLYQFPHRMMPAAEAPEQFRLRMLVPAPGGASATANQ